MVDAEDNRLVQTWQAHSREICEVRALLRGTSLVIVSTSKNGEAKVRIKLKLRDQGSEKPSHKQCQPNTQSHPISRSSSI